MFLYPQTLSVLKTGNLALRVQLCDGADGRLNPVSDKAFFSRYVCSPRLPVAFPHSVLHAKCTPHEWNA
jgi:hypothetical protein